MLFIIKFDYLPKVLLPMVILLKFILLPLVKLVTNFTKGTFGYEICYRSFQNIVFIVSAS